MSYVPHSDADRQEMLRAAGVSSEEELFADIPDKFRLREPLDLPSALSEWETVRTLGRLANESKHLLCFAGAGYYDHHTPAAVDHLIRRSEFYTAYTPYQAEVSQGTLQSIYEFQSMICELTGLDVANASMYDGASAMAEAALMADSIQRDRQKIVLSITANPHYRQVLDTYNLGLQLPVEIAPRTDGGVTDLERLKELVDDDTSAVIVQSPNFYGAIEDLEAAAGIAHDAGALFIAVVDPVSLALLKSPGACGADIAVAEGQPLGIPLSYGGPVLGLFAARGDYIRSMPGRIVGQTEDVDGRRGFVLTLQTREQHIRREKATSNICTNQGLIALAATIYMATVGKGGLRQVAETSAQVAHYAYDRIVAETDLEPLFPDAPFVREFALQTPGDARQLIEKGADRGILAGVALSRFPHIDVDDGLLVAFTEKRSKDDVDLLLEVLKEA
ncbi:MAG: aminomethyl-transferring glycine dehydrogenase subunit GcvPA [Gemmatimonadetes bacterium]|uniref:Probable glycine dehydrogenase (decarboxylating) subunit 1 n=1 Tax=Candidatus Kutchimonas denitrificans TaxID=3056748 RepID=A0AAE4Z9T5_9BACT|nr:aminomethyl-transferring glycine dehydrogenase subunit GcvPA [Gemmatimonadota bacterium]NIR75312.1 aminomethyl-transferring glycine dehydrogenase subunit GcvPA [Candidatus Kutchimonas denitrificans]NIS02138.1 aminomethyl-transferring glycine dehydrogenase subunit GcvPA [Gemmatimonadota bacterium]NIT67963.1 aminomethyl-transferring glycine dehydrogenase subunit GcvPA [Gemmatimonadota bacterium]NIU53957.1 aminomethyl-transferring glycine dehydrogenase subunit GcvPA [Gemmatimonadota bacterium]